MSGDELLKRDAKRNLGDELLISVKEMREEKVGCAHEIKPHDVPQEIDVQC